jgi:hypothetical protein
LCAVTTNVSRADARLQIAAMEKQWRIRMKLYTSEEAFDKLHILVSDSKTNINIKRATLVNLLMDHSNMVDMLEQKGERLNKGKPKKG